MLNNHVLEVRVNKGADPARLRDWLGAGSPCAVSAPRPGNWRPSLGSTRDARSNEVDLLHFSPYRPGMNDRLLLRWPAAPCDVPLGLECRRCEPA
jgi:hypothetical protein